MGQLKLYIAMLKLLDDTATELGFQTLTNNDKIVLTCLYGAYSEDEFSVKYNEFSRIFERSKLSKSQFYNSINKLVSLNILEKIGSIRGHTYKFTTPQ
jgi:hypothetical protein